MTKRKATTIQLPRRRVIFRCGAGPQSDVRLAGTFNNWNTATHRLTWKNGIRKHTTTILLPVGRHEYKFVVDNAWQCDPACPDRAPNQQGTLNSVIEIK